MMSLTASLSEKGSHNDCDDQGSISVYSEGEGRSSRSFGLEAGQKKSREEVLAAKETRAVRWSRFGVVMVLLGSAAAVSCCVYFYTRNVEVSDFEKTFSVYAEQITMTVHRNAQNKLEAVGAVALQVQTHAVTTGATWPNVTYPFFEDNIMASQSLLDAYGVALFPVVTNETREEWEEYSVEHRGWLNDSFAAQRHTYGEDQSRLMPGDTSDPDFNWFDHLWGEGYYNESNPDFSAGISNKIFGTTFNADRQPLIDPSDGPFFPQWQAAAASWYYQTTVNSNYGNFEDFFNQTQIIMETGTAAYGMAWSDGNTPGYISTMLYPIFESFYDDQPEVVGFVGVDLFWQSFIERILPPDADGIYIVIQNEPPCDQVFTFQLFGNKAEFVGDGDLHETDFTYLKRSFLFGGKLMEPIQEPTYTGRPMYDDFCPYTFSLYPSQVLEDKYVTNMPIYFTIIVCGIFLFTSMVFLTYDCFVERRQKLVLQSANQADAVVSSLFPKSVKEQLYEKERNNLETKKRMESQSVPGGETIKEFMGVSNPNASINDSTAGVSPIAELYPNTTILFMDLVGFTTWSRNRQPTEVFQLLETLYGSFDAVAKRRGVFKVETIGDCYVAVTGLPKPQEQHASIMVKFAAECQVKMRQELHSLVDALGDSTLELALRTGMHSGPVTAGVLRGDKARFQLFGDSMNFAARMESTSAPNRIHTSEATAMLLRQAGKSRWVKAREEKINPKGIGEIQTYWIDTRGDQSVMGSHRAMSVMSSQQAPTSSFHSATEPEDQGSNVERSVEFQFQSSFQYAPSTQLWV